MESRARIDITLTGQFLRCGKQVRLILGNRTDRQARLDERLIQEVVRALRWFDDLASRRVTTITELARRSNINVAHVSRRMTLAFLAPDILEQILNGCSRSVSRQNGLVARVGHASNQLPRFEQGSSCARPKMHGKSPPHHDWPSKDEGC